MPDEPPIPLRARPHPSTSSSSSSATLRPQSHLSDRPTDAHDDGASARFSSPVIVSHPSSRQLSRNSSPFTHVRRPEDHVTKGTGLGKEEGVQLSHRLHEHRRADLDPDLEFEDWDEPEDNMPSDLRPERQHTGDGRSLTPLLAGHNKTDSEDYGAETRTPLSRRSTFHERDPVSQAKYETRKRYTYAAIFLVLSLVSFVVQTETAVYIQHELKWEKPYCML